jgi:hypothetical protein
MLTVSEVFPGSQAAFQSITAGAGSITVDVVDTGIGLQSLTLVSSTNANVSIPAFPQGTVNPVTTTFTRTNPSQPVDFTLRAGLRREAVLIRAQCGSAARAGFSLAAPDISFWLPTVGLNDLFSLALKAEEMGMKQ